MTWVWIELLPRLPQRLPLRQASGDESGGHQASNGPEDQVVVKVIAEVVETLTREHSRQEQIWQTKHQTDQGLGKFENEHYSKWTDIIKYTE